jgi:DNA modification methylase
VSEWLNRVFAKSCEAMPEIPDGSVHCCVTSPPYFGLREYETEGQIGHEPTVAEYVARLVTVFREVRRVLRDDGTLWLNLGDSYAGGGGGNYGTGLSNAGSAAGHHVTNVRNRDGWLTANSLKAKDLMGIPWRVALALQADGWWLRDAIVWAKPNPMPSSVTDRCTSSYEMVFMLAKSKTYYADMDAVREPLAESSVARLEQAGLEQQAGSARANGGAKTNGTMKAVARAGRTPANPEAHEALESRAWAWENRVAAAGANLRNVWTIATTPFSGDHPAVMPRALAQRCILIGTPPGGIVLDPFMGSGTVAEVALGSGRNYVGYELNPEYHKVIATRLGLFGAAS